MFSKREFRRFLAQTRELEQRQIALFQDILRDIEDKELRKLFQGLLDSEIRHDNALKEIEKL